MPYLPDYIKNQNKSKCFCNSSFDLRCCCWVLNNDGTKNEAFKHCPQKISTTYQRCRDEYDWKTFFEEEGQLHLLKPILKKKCGFTNKDWEEFLYFHINQLLEELE